jgi:hypothetical protein
VREIRVAPIAGIPLVHRVVAGIPMELGGSVPWVGSVESARAIVADHVVGTSELRGMHPTIDVPPWCTYLAGSEGDVAIRFHRVNRGDVVRVVRTLEPGHRYEVRYESVPRVPIMPLQSELAIFSLALTSRGIGLIAHSCGFALADGSGVLCPGMSGTGKTTLAGLLGELDQPPTVLSDDRTVVTHTNGELRLWGSPWPGAARIAAPGGGSLDVVVFIRHGKAMTLRSISPREAFRRILNALAMPLWDERACGPALEIVDAIVSRARLVEATYPRSRASAEWLVDALAERAHA